MPMYTHRPLSPGRIIRILLLQPHHNPSEPIRINLEEISLPKDKNERGTYEALSYVWGAPIGDQPIECDGDQLLITENCFAALRSLRSKNEVRKLWIDAICIDQTATQTAVQEKNHQLKLMGEVYAHAQRVLIWLGQGDDRIVTLMDRFSRTDQLVVDSPAAVAALVSNEWFNRAWTVQELCYAQDPVVIYDQIQVPWEPFVACLDWKRQKSINDVPGYLYNPYVQTTSFRGLFQLLTDPSKLIDRPRGPGWTSPVQAVLFGFLRSRKSSRPEDKIYAFHQVLTDLGFILPDLDVSRSIAELYEETTYLLIEQARSLKMLEYLPSQSRMDNLPSWVPDYSQALWPPGHIVGLSVQSLRRGQTIERITGQLKLRAIYLDVVAALSGRMPDLDQANISIPSQVRHDTALRCYETMHSWMKFVVGFEAPLAYDEHAEDAPFLEQDTIDILGETYAITATKPVDVARLTALARLVAQVGNSTEYKSPSEYIQALSPISTIPQLWSWLQFIHDTKARNTVADTHPDRAVAEQLRNGHPFQIFQLIHHHEQEKNSQRNNMISTLERHFSIKSPEQKLYATRRGLLGLTAGDVQQDDVVALLPGSAVPILLRAVDLSKRTFRVVGPSYLPDSSDVEWNNPEMPDEAFDDVILV
jgi:Heterokaryon incompatibility protein (HET)